VDLIDDVNLVAAVGRHVLDVFAQLTHLVDTVVRRTIDLEYIRRRLPAVISTQERQALQGVAVGPCSQFMAFASMRAMVVFPVPRGPENRMAWATRPAAMALIRVRVTWDPAAQRPQSSGADICAQVQDTLIITPQQDNNALYCTWRKDATAADPLRLFSARRHAVGPAILSKLSRVGVSANKRWRRERDSNPRCRYKRHTRFPVVLLQPARTSLRM
jgi:hypothetical protein